MSNLTGNSGNVNYGNNGSGSNKSMSQSPVGAISSETTSETQSVSDEQIARICNTTNRSNNKTPRKLSKEAEKERPPWRTVITAPVPKVNKNALLKAKILDATRRALLAQRICHIGTQTEDLAKLVREKSIDVQKDLICMLDKSVDTDGTITIRRDCPGGLIINQTVGQMTDQIRCYDIATQTALPRTNLAFTSLTSKVTRKANDGLTNRNTYEDQIQRNDTLLQKQSNDLQCIDKKLKNAMGTTANFKINGTYVGCNDNNWYSGNDEIKYFDCSSIPVECEKANLEPNDERMHNKQNEKAMRINITDARDATFAFWDDLDVMDNENDLPNLPRKSISEGSTPWNNFKDLIIGQRLAAMTLSPIPRMSSKSLKKKTVTWNDRQLAVTKLLNEASALVDIFDEMSMILGPEVKLNSAPVPQMDLMEIQKSKWDPILAESCNVLQEKLAKFKPLRHLSSAELLNTGDQTEKGPNKFTHYEHEYNKK